MRRTRSHYRCSPDRQPSWNRSNLGNRTKMIEALREHGSRYDRLIVILQPRVTSKAYMQVREQLDAVLSGEKKATAMTLRMQQLDTLLEGA